GFPGGCWRDLAAVHRLGVSRSLIDFPDDAVIFAEMLDILMGVLEMKNEDLAGKWLLLYFGFTHCPDVCPESMEQLTGVVDALDMDLSLSPVQPVFITVDPERDDPKALALYIKDFHPRLIGLTGLPENVERVTKAFRVFNSRGPPTADGDYLVDHSVLIFLVDPRGSVRDFFARDHPLEKMTSSITRHVQQG
uniref:SCO cytochrome c oxidase assembly protein 2 n=1 Tax=Eptatretus burgeri TaxID=7764 RepID=A0A8C4N332_EPTBU